MLQTLINILFQDLPYLAIRLSVLFSQKTELDSIVFYLSKNVLVILITVYRLTAACMKDVKNVSVDEVTDDIQVVTDGIKDVDDLEDD